jgi:hypothetical protein
MARKEAEDIIPALAAMHAAAYAEQERAGVDHLHPRARRPFVTISRQAGAGGRSFATKLVEQLNAVERPVVPWTVWDNELVEKVVAEHHLPAASVASLEERPPSWFEESLAGLTMGDWREHPPESAVYSRVAMTIRALAEIGRVVIVGRGGAFITRDLPDGVHLRLVAPLAYRVAQTAKAMGASASVEAAAAVVREKDENREAFYRRHWPSRPLVPESFTACFNTAAVPSERLIACVLPLIVSPVPQPAATRTGGAR